MTKFFAMFAIVATMGAALLGAATLANANTYASNTYTQNTGSGTVDYPGYPDWADEALAPKGTR